MVGIAIISFSFSSVLLSDNFQLASQPRRIEQWQQLMALPTGDIAKLLHGLLSVAQECQGPQVGS